MARRLFFHGSSGSTEFYAVFMRMSDQKLWRVTDSTWMSLVDDEWDGTSANLDVSLTESNKPATDGPLNSFYVEVPNHHNFGSGAFAMFVYDKMMGTPDAQNALASVHSDAANFGNAIQVFYFDGRSLVDGVVYDVLAYVHNDTGLEDRWVLIPRKNGTPLYDDAGNGDVSGTPTLSLKDPVGGLLLNAVSLSTDTNDMYFWHLATATQRLTNKVYAGWVDATIGGAPRRLPFVVSSRA